MDGIAAIEARVAEICARYAPPPPPAARRPPLPTTPSPPTSGGPWAPGLAPVPGLRALARSDRYVGY